MRALAAVLIVGLACALAAPAQVDARREYREGRKAEREGRDLEAWMHYLRARGAEPANETYAHAAANLRVAAAQALAATGREADAREVVGMEPTPDSPVVKADDAEDDPRDIRRLREPVTLEPQRVVSTFYLDGTIREAYEQVAER
ncbi:MAG: hypothetical protein KDC27_21855, partial [Acidobacteria bacterium]|nr:hypothetical protein [Acidobacteriota bacterium]